jgi:hypothetical protein
MAIGKSSYQQYVGRVTPLDFFARIFWACDLIAHREPVLKIIEQNSIKDMQEQEDIAFLDHAKSCAGLSTLRLNETPAATGGFLGFTTGAQVDAFFKGATPVANPRTANIVLSPNNYFRRETIADMAKILLARQLELKAFLMSAQDFVDTLRWHPWRLPKHASAGLFRPAPQNPPIAVLNYSAACMRFH